jgi:predicted DNA-binding WGR domain protein
LKVFFSEESLAETGKGHFSKSIENALDQASVLVLVASTREHIESRWVEAEWDSFMNDVRSGNKKGELFIVNCGSLRGSDLPLFLRRQQMFQTDELEKLVKFVKSALPRPKQLEDYVKASLHCFDPKKNEDKIYILTIQEGLQHERFHVTAYWGARTAKRLSSMMKAINFTDEQAVNVLEKARQEKIRSGYKSRPLSKILTKNARQQLLASFGLTDLKNEKPAVTKSSPARSVSKDNTASKTKSKRKQHADERLSQVRKNGKS